MRVITGMSRPRRLAASLRSFATALAEAGWTDAEVVGRLLDGHGLAAGKLARYTSPQRCTRTELLLERHLIYAEQ